MMHCIFRKTAFLIDLGGKRKHSTPIGLAKEWVSVLQSCYPGEFVCPGQSEIMPWYTYPTVHSLPLLLARTTRPWDHRLRSVGTEHVPLPRPPFLRPSDPGQDRRRRLFRPRQEAHRRHGRRRPATGRIRGETFDPLGRRGAREVLAGLDRGL
jgi:hypothetical protein